LAFEELVDRPTNIAFTVIQVIMLFIYFRNLAYAIYHSKHGKHAQSQRVMVLNFKLQYLYSIATLYYPWYFYPINTFTAIIGTILKFGANRVIQFFYLMLGIIDASNEYFQRFDNRDILVIRNLVTLICVGIILIVFALSLIVTSFLCFRLDDLLNLLSTEKVELSPEICPNRDIIVSSIIAVFLFYVIRILMDNYIYEKRKEVHWFFRGLFLICRVCPILLLFFYSRLFENDLSHIFYTFIGAYYSRFATKIVILDYLMLNHFANRAAEENESAEESEAEPILRISSSLFQ
jgi:hypothetical protein